MTKYFLIFCISFLSNIASAQVDYEFTTANGKITLNGDSVLKYSKVRVMGTKESRLSGMSGKYSIPIPKNIDVFLMIADKYIAKINSNNKNFDINLFTGSKDLSEKYFEEWNKNKTKNETLWTKIYQSKFKPKMVSVDLVDMDNGRNVMVAPNGPVKPITGKDDTNRVFDADDLEKKPMFPSGEKGWADYLKQKMIYPEEAKDNNRQGKVLISFVVEKDGSLTDVLVLRAIAGLEKEAIRLVKTSPKWLPGVYNGSPVRSRINVTIPFKIEE